MPKVQVKEMAMNGRYDQPFCIIGNERLQKRWGRTHLPPLEPPPGYYGWGYGDPPEEEDQPKVRPMSEHDAIGQMRGQLLYLMNKVHELEKRRTKRSHGVY